MISCRVPMRLLAVSIFASICLHAETAPAVRPVPPPGVPVPDADRKELEGGLKRLHDSIVKLHGNPLLPDIEIFHEAVRYALSYDEFFKTEEMFRAKELLRMGQARADELGRGGSSWTTSPGLVVRGYVSKIDKSVQPYGLVVPASYSPNVPHRWRLDTWFHGRGETLSEVNFLWDRIHNPGEFTPRDTLVLHLYGRYCNANKLAGEVDLFEALDAVKRSYPVDENRIIIRGFSMGGAAAWHIAAHHAGLWAAAAPGAGFSETPDFLKVWEKDTLKPTWWEQKLWHLYNATDYAANLFNCPTIAYSGEIDPQMQAAKMMERSLAEEGMRLTHLIGPNTPHRYHPDSKVAINALLDAIVETGRELYPRKLRFTTWTLAYNEMKWVTIDTLDRHWERARLDAEVTDQSSVNVQASNVQAFTIKMGAGCRLLSPSGKVTVSVNNQHVVFPGPMTDRSFTAHLRRVGTKWTAVDREDDGTLRKRHGLQGPIDDAFLDSFLVVHPTGEPIAAGISPWVASEETRFIKEWRRQFRGDAQVKNDVDITPEDIAGSNLILWGDPGSNKLLGRIVQQLPIRWSEEGIALGPRTYSAATTALVMIYPNPLNPKRYVVLNSGFTFREYDYLNNARQVPKLPDYAVIDTSTPPDARYPGKIFDAGFFDDGWQLVKNNGQ